LRTGLHGRKLLVDAEGKMERRKSKYEGNKKIKEDEAAYPDHNTILLIDLLAELAVETALTKAKALYDISPPPPPPDIDSTP
jgi:hypothetical protein